MKATDSISEELRLEDWVEARYRVAFLYANYEQYLVFLEKFASRLHIECFNTVQGVLDVLAVGFPADAIIASVDNHGWELLKKLRSGGILANIPVILVAGELTPGIIRRARESRADDIFDEHYESGDLIARLHYLFKRKWYAAEKAALRVKEFRVKTPLWKRSLDILIAGSALLVLSPVLLLVALIIRIDSPGAVLYKSKRVGSGFKVFDLYKFRTMRTNADKLLKNMASENMYNRSPESNQPVSGTLCEDCWKKGLDRCEQMLFFDGREICERVYQREKEQKAAFMKFQNDPRITRVGRFLRNTSLDELPQLINILKGDMSLVGNRPLPIYEAEKLTTDENIMRFAGPAGLTGLWQVTKRGKGAAEMSEEERVALDIYYVRNLSFMLDLKIVLKTFPALLQSENV